MISLKSFVLRSIYLKLLGMIVIMPAFASEKIFELRGNGVSNCGHERVLREGRHMCEEFLHTSEISLTVLWSKVAVAKSISGARSCTFKARLKCELSAQERARREQVAAQAKRDADDNLKRIAAQRQREKLERERRERELNLQKQLREQISELEVGVRTLETTLASKKSEVQGLNRRKDELTTRRQAEDGSFQATVQGFTAERDRINREAQELTAAVASRQATLGERNQALTQLEQHCEQLRAVCVSEFSDLRCDAVSRFTLPSNAILTIHHRDELLEGQVYQWVWNPQIEQAVAMEEAVEEDGSIAWPANLESVFGPINAAEAVRRARLLSQEAFESLRSQGLYPVHAIVRREHDVVIYLKLLRGPRG